MPSYPAPMSLQIDDLILPMVPEEETLTPPAPRTSPHPWPPRLPLDLALGAESQTQILDRYSISEDDFTRWALTPAFRRAVAEAARDVREQGLTFKLLCQSIAQDFLQELDACMHDKTIGFANRLDAFKTISKLAGLEPKDVKDQNTGANLVQININL